MSGRSFRSVFMVASCAGAALGCYLVSLRVASERSALEDVETKIVLAQRDIRLLQTEIGTRGRLAQLERWNASVIALSAPSADQFLKGGFELARLTAPEHRPAIEAPVVMASASTDVRPEASAETAAPSGPAALLHEASLKTSPPPRVVPEPAVRTVAQPTKAAPTEGTDPKRAKGKTTAAATRDEVKKPQAAKPAGDKSAVAKTAASKPAAKAAVAAKPVKTAARNPLAPLPQKKAKLVIAAAKPGKPTKDLARKQ